VCDCGDAVDVRGRRRSESEARVVGAVVALRDHCDCFAHAAVLEAEVEHRAVVLRATAEAERAPERVVERPHARHVGDPQIDVIENHHPARFSPTRGRPRAVLRYGAAR
jgi:hypothetical protein